MSPEMLLIQNGLGIGEFNPELSDIFSRIIIFKNIFIIRRNRNIRIK